MEVDIVFPTLGKRLVHFFGPEIGTGFRAEIRDRFFVKIDGRRGEICVPSGVCIVLVEAEASAMQEEGCSAHFPCFPSLSSSGLTPHVFDVCR